MLKTCPHCEEEFESNHARRIYCSDSHRVSAYYKRKGFKVVLIAPNEKTEVLEGIPSKKDKEAYNNSFLKQTTASATGNIVAQTLANLMTKDENKTVKKKDLKELYKAIQRDQQIFHQNTLREVRKMILQAQNPYL